MNFTISAQIDPDDFSALSDKLCDIPGVSSVDRPSTGGRNIVVHAQGGADTQEEILKQVKEITGDRHAYVI